MNPEKDFSGSIGFTREGARSRQQMEERLDIVAAVAEFSRTTYERLSTMDGVQSELGEKRGTIFNERGGLRLDEEANTERIQSVLDVFDIVDMLIADAEEMPEGSRQAFVKQVKMVFRTLVDDEESVETLFSTEDEVRLLGRKIVAEDIDPLHGKEVLSDASSRGEDIAIDFSRTDAFSKVCRSLFDIRAEGLYNALLESGGTAEVHERVDLTVMRQHFDTLIATEVLFREISKRAQYEARRDLEFRRQAETGEVTYVHPYHAYADQIVLERYYAGGGTSDVRQVSDVSRYAR
ncbi:hypothetical protein JXA34_01485 [Patescibacteria group bacterium]|nr:hypothetical protein [Patescibacteria group bacterium]